MKDKYLIIYQNSALLLNKVTVSEAQLADQINTIINNYQGEVIAVTKIMVSE